MAFFSTKNISVQKEGLNLGSKFEVFFTNSLYSFCRISGFGSIESGHFQCPLAKDNLLLFPVMLHQEIEAGGDYKSDDCIGNHIAIFHDLIGELVFGHHSMQVPT